MITTQEYEALLAKTELALAVAEEQVVEWKDRCARISEASLRRSDLLHKIVEAVKGHSVEEGTYSEAQIPGMVRQEIMDAAAAVGRRRRTSIR